MIDIKTNKKIEICIKEMLFSSKYKLPFYGEFNLGINFIKTDSIPTCGVNVNNKGMNFYHNDEFLSKLPQEEVNFIDIHEIYHLLFDHPKRTVTGSYDPKMANVVQDMIINDIIWCDISREFIQIPKGEDGKNMALFPPKEYTGKMIFEHLYNWLAEQKDKRDKEKKNQNTDNKSEGSEGNNSKEYGKNGRCSDGSEVDTWGLDSILDNLEETNGEYLDSHIEDEASKEFREELVKQHTHSIIERLKMKGVDVGNIENSIQKLRKKKKDYLKEIKRNISNVIMGTNKYRTISRKNRKNINGLKGNKKMKSKINVILDTSGSMSGLFEKTLSYIFQNDIEVNLIQCDTQVQSIQTIKNMRDLKNIHIKGLGGTVINPAIYEIVENFNTYNTCILTDGYTDSLDLSGHKGSVLILTTNSECPIASKPKKKLKQITIDTNYD